MMQALTARQLLILIDAPFSCRLSRYNLGVKGGKQRIQFFVSIQAKAQLERLAPHYGYTVTSVIEKLAADAERALLSRLPPQKQTVYLDGHRARTTTHKASIRHNTRLSKKARSSSSRLRRKVTV
jgi:hypothetical protein